MKKKILAIYIAMIFVGVIGILMISGKSESPPVLPEVIADNPTEPVQEMITVAIALKDIEAKTVLSKENIRLQTMKIVRGSNEKSRYSIDSKVMINSIVNIPIAEGSIIPVSSVIEPDSTEYLSMFLQPGNVLYTFQLSQADNYLFDNIKSGQSIDVYLAYGKKIGNDGREEIVSPSSSIENTRLKPLLKDRRVLSLRPAKVVDRNGVPIIEGGSQLIAELRDSDVKLLKGLEDKAKLIIFPASYKEQNIGDKAVLSDVEAMWPVSENIIFGAGTSGSETSETKLVVNELRG